MPTMDEDVPVERPVTFRKIYATNVLVGMTEYDIRVEFFNERFGVDDPESEKEKWLYISEGMTILTPLAAKRLKNALNRKIKKYEEVNGKIKESDKLPVFYTKVEKQK